METFTICSLPRELALDVLALMKIQAQEYIKDSKWDDLHEMVLSIRLLEDDLNKGGEEQ